VSYFRYGKKPNSLSTRVLEMDFRLFPRGKRTFKAGNSERIFENVEKNEYNAKCSREHGVK
jgi:hypothetical protein